MAKRANRTGGAKGPAPSGGAGGGAHRASSSVAESRGLRADGSERRGRAWRSDEAAASRTQRVRGVAHWAVSRRSSWGSALKTVFGAGMLWAWQYATFLSAALFLSGSFVRSRSELELGFYILQAAAMLFAVVLVFLHYRRPLNLATGHTLLAAGGLTVATLGLFVALRIHALWLVAVASIVAGICSVVMVAAWGARFSLGSKSSGQLVVVSFLIACAIYLAMPLVPNEAAIGVLLALPLGSWVCWISDATARHSLSSSVFGRADSEEDVLAVRPTAPFSSDSDAPTSPEELTAGNWRIRAIPWRAISVLVAASFVGGMVASLLMAMTRAGVGDIFHNGAWVVAIVCVVTSITLFAEHNTLSVRSMYHIMVTLTVFGLLVLLVFGRVGFVVGGAFAQGCSLFLQIMIYIIMTRSTQRFDMAPLFSFSIGQAVAAAVVLAGALSGQLIYAMASKESLMLPITCGFGILVLFYMVTSHVGRAEELGLSRDTYADAETEAPGELAEPEVVENPTAMCGVRFDVPTVSAATGGRTGAGAAVGFSGSSNALIEGGSAAATSTDIASLAEGAGENVAVELLPEHLEQERLDRFSQVYGLTGRETEVFAYLAHGRSRPYIADALYVTTGTVKTHTTHIYRKLEVGSKQELIDLYESFR